MVPTDRRTLLAALGSGAVALAGCLAGRASPGPFGGDDEETAESGSRGPKPPTVDRSLPAAYEIDELLETSRSGGPSPDGIPAVENPRFTPATDSPDALDDDDPVFGVEIDGEAKAYPQSILVWHEIVNDVVGGRPVSVTYCPLTGTAQGFHRGETTFGVSGQLINSNLVMFDRGTESWWPQILATAISGEDAGSHLEEFQLIWTTWARWRSTHPDTVVLSEETGFARNYGRDPYGGYNPPQGYYENDSFLFGPLTEDDRLHPKAVVIGMRSEHGAVAIGKDRLREERLLAFELGGVDHLAAYDDALDTGYVYRIDDSDAPPASWEGGRVAIDGVDYEPADLPYERAIAFDAMWFAWYGYYPMTDLYE